MVRCIYSTIRFGSYEPILDLLHRSLSPGRSESDIPAPFLKFTSSLLSGGIGAFIANPTDLVKVNLQSVLPSNNILDKSVATRTSARPLSYSTALGGLRYIYRTEGIRRGLYRGGLFTTARAAILTSAVIGSYDSIKNNILKKHFGMQDGNILFITCSMLAGVITTTAANPG